MRFLSFRNNDHSCFRCLLILGIASNPLLSVLPLHPASLPFPLSDIPPYSKRFRRIPTIKDVMYSLTCDADIMTKITEDT